MDKKKITVIISLASIGIIAVSGIIFLIKKIYIKDKNMILKILSKILSYPLFKNNKKIITDIINTALKLKNIKEIQVESSDNTFKANKESDDFPKFFLSDKIIHNSKNIGILKIAFIE